ncbi:glycine-rich domain-containing protein [Algoriphagus aquatilis]|uniref:Glycine-rich domain-containing protein n=2 Tax=Bacteroidota TaxID=976 RepID=A0ABW0BU79_9BACT
MKTLRQLFQNIFKTAPLLMGLGIILLFSRNVFGQSQTFSATGAVQQFTVPAGVTSITVEAWGGGGRGSSGSNRGGGGGGGGYSRSILSVTPGQTLNLYVGRGSTTTGAGEDSYFINLTTIRARGGNSTDSNTGANGALIGVGDITYTGGRGADGETGGSARSGGGGSSAGNGNDGISATNQNGAIAPPGGGNGGNGRVNDGAGSPGNFPGGGGGGRYGNSGTGGSGANGQIIVSWCLISLTSSPASPNQTLCSGSPIAPIEYAFTGVTGITNQLMPAGLTATYSGDVLNGTLRIIGTPPTAPGIYPYEVVLQGNCSGTVISGSIRISENNSFDPISEDDFCLGSPISGITQATFRATGIGTPTGLPPGISASWNANQILFTGTPTATGTYNYSIPLTGGCGTVNATGTIRVNDVLAITNPQLGAQALCVGNSFTPLSVGTGFGYSYQWFENTTSSNTGGTPISGANSNSYTPSSSTAGTQRYYYVEITGFCGGSIKSNPSGLIETLSGNTVSAAPTPTTVCINSAIPTITHTTTGATGILNNGVGGANGLPTGVSATWLGNTISITGTPTVSGTFNYSIPLTGGCGTVNATGTITVNAQPSAIPLSGFTTNQSRCINVSPGFSALSVEARPGFSYQWYLNTSGTIDPGTDTPVGTNSNSYSPLNDGSVPASSRYYVVVSSNTSCGTASISALSGVFTVNPLPTVLFEPTQPSGSHCVDTNLTYTTQSGQSNYLWTIPGVANTDYTIVSGGNSTSNWVTIKWLTPGNKSISVNYISPSGCTASSPTFSNTITVQKNTVAAPSLPLSACSDGTFITINLITSGATGIGTPVVLPNGLNATLSGNMLTISGTVDPLLVPPGNYTYNIPLTGGCGTVSASGSIEVQPAYQLTSTTSVAPSASGGLARVTITGNPSILTNGTYEVTYDFGLANSALGTRTASVSVTNGRGTFNTIPIPNDQLTSLTITSIRKTNVSTSCPTPISNNNETFFGFGDTAFPDGGIFYVPAGIFEITVKVWGGGGGGARNDGGGGGGSGYSEVTIAVVPGSTLYLYVGNGGAGATNSSAPQNGQPSYVSRTPNPTNPETGSVAYASGGIAANGTTGGNGGQGNNRPGNQGQNGVLGTSAGRGGNGGAPGSQGGNSGVGNNADGANGTLGGGGGGARGNGDGGTGGKGLVVVSYGLPPVGPCFVVLDDGARSGNTIIEFTCSGVWQAPEGLIEFTVTSVGGGGGGGRGKAAGGGGAGGFAQETINVNATFGLPANSNFNVTVGQGGQGASDLSQRGGKGGNSSVTGTVDGVSRTIAPVEGGGGGGSTNSINGGSGESGASGGGGAYDDNVNGLDDRNNGGNGSSGFSGGGVQKKTFTNDINKGAAAGGGGGGAAGPGLNGGASGAGNASGGNGGPGLSYVIGTTTYYRNGGGGGNGFNFEGNSLQQAPGLGGTFSGIPLGGDGSVNGIGGAGVARTGSGGGSGISGGGTGGSGRVFITYPVFRILPLDYLYFNAKYDPADREGNLSWAVTKEWENSHFEVERSINNVQHWNKIGEVSGKGYSDKVTEYRYIDKTIPAAGGTIFYRLKQVNLSGSYFYTETRAIQVDPILGTSSWVVYPNPTSGIGFKLELISDDQLLEGDVTATVSSVLGQVEYFNDPDISRLSSRLGSYLQTKAAGIYILTLNWSGKTESFRIIKR